MKIATISCLNLSKKGLYHRYSVMAHPIVEQNVKIHQYTDFMRKLQILVFRKKFSSKATFFSLANFRGFIRSY